MKKHLLSIMAAAALLLIAAAPQSYPVIYMIGDSTMANKSIEGGKPERGWGMMLPGYFDSRIKVDNRALNGRSSKSFRDEGRWDPIMEKMKKGDYVFIQFGHNDEKPAENLHSDAETSFRDNLRRYITETREKGGIPVLFPSIARRNFVGDSLVDTHGAYIDAVFAVGKEMGVTVIDLNKSSIEMILSVPKEESKKFFMWIPKNTVPAVAAGAEDNTHLNVYGGRVMAGMAADSIEKRIPELAPFIRRYDFVVAKDGSGNFFTVQEAIDAVPDMRSKRTTVYIRSGVYKEKLVLPASKQNVSFVGEEAETTVLTYDDYASKKNSFGEDIGTSGSSSFFIYANGFNAENITFENSSGPVGQAVAVYAHGSGMTFKKCRFIGNQDTLYAHGEGSIQHYEDCYIEGTVDFIFGPATAFFNGCTIRSKRGNSYITAASTPEGTKYGFVFNGCKLTADEGVGGVFLGRPWRPYARTLFINCDMGAHIAPEGWHNWNKPEAEATTLYGEYGNSGKGSSLSKRVKWAHIVTKEEAAEALQAEKR